MITKERIDQRNAEAAERRRGQNLAQRIEGGIGLGLANAWDLLTGWTKDDRLVFLGGTGMGMTRGALIGLAVGIVLIAALPFGVGMVWGTVIGVGAIVAGAAIVGVREGQQALDAHLATGRKGIADAIAEKTGAVGHDPKHSDQIAALRAVSSPEPQPTSTLPFQEREDARRLGAQRPSGRVTNTSSDSAPGLSR